MRNPEQILENLNKQSVKHSKDNSYKFNELYKNFVNPLFYKHVYADKISGTKGIDGEVAFCEKTIQRIINCMRDEIYQPTPISRTCIPTEMSAMADRCIQEIINKILTTIYEPVFSADSYGFRQGMDYHNAIHAIQTTFQDMVWFIEGNIRSFFSNIDHHIMIKILKQRIDDERFTRLIWKFLRAGYLEEWIFDNNTYSCTPQGGIISPVLSNIYLNEFDKHIKQLQEAFNKGNNNKTAISPSYRNMCYVRYADDFILGIIGSRKEAENIKKDLGIFLKERLKLELLQEKTLITHSSNKVRFLSHEFSIHRNDIAHKVKNPENGIVEPQSNRIGQIRITMPKDIIIKRLKELNVVENFNAEKWKARRNTKIIGNSDLEIVETYNEQIRELYNYFRLADNVSSEMNKFYQIMKWSMFHTYAAKYKSTVPKMLKKYRIGNTGEYGIPYETKQGTQIRKFYHEGFKRKNN